MKVFSSPTIEAGINTVDKRRESRIWQYTILKQRESAEGSSILLSLPLHTELQQIIQIYLSEKKKPSSGSIFCIILRQSKKHTPKLNITKQMSLSKEISTLTKDIEELKSELSNLILSYMYKVSFMDLCS